jgi:hypothetical protein
MDIVTGLLQEPVERQVEREWAKLNPPPAAPTLYGSEFVTVGENPVRDVRVVLSEAARVSGTIVFHGDGEKPPLAGVRIAVSLVAPDGRIRDVMKAGWVTRSGTFATYGSPPGQYYARILGGIPGWSVESVRLGDRDLLDLPIDLGTDHVAGVELRVVQSQASISGTVNLDAKPDGQATVLVFPEDKRLWKAPDVAPTRFRSVRASTKGRFRVDDLRPGRYFLVAVPDSRVEGWNTPEQLGVLEPLAISVQLERGGSQSVTLNTRFKR